MSIAVVGELVVRGRELLEALRCYAREVACKFRVLCEDHRPTRHEAIDQRLLSHGCAIPKPNHKREKMEVSERGRERV